MFDPRQSHPAALARMIYGSNMLSSAGNNLDVTRQLCASVFRGEEPVSLDVDARDPQTRALRSHLRRTRRRRDTVRAIVKSCREVVQHARAVSYAVDRVVVRREPWTEGLLRKLHRILHVGLEDRAPDAGCYRPEKFLVLFGKPRGATQSATFVPADAVPGYMRELVRHLNADIARADAESAESRGLPSPYATAARYHHQLLGIAPFDHGNGLIARIVVNTILWRLGMERVCEIGESWPQMNEYAEIANRGVRAFREEDGRKGFGEHTGHLEMAGFLARTTQNWREGSGRSRQG